MHVVSNSALGPYPGNAHVYIQRNIYKDTDCSAVYVTKSPPPLSSHRQQEIAICLYNGIQVEVKTAKTDQQQKKLKNTFRNVMQGGKQVVKQWDSLYFKKLSLLLIAGINARMQWKCKYTCGNFMEMVYTGERYLCQESRGRDRGELCLQLTFDFFKMEKDEGDVANCICCI